MKSAPYRVQADAYGISPVWGLQSSCHFPVFQICAIETSFVRGRNGLQAKVKSQGSGISFAHCNKHKSVWSYSMNKLALKWHNDGRMQQAVAISEQQSVGKSVPAREHKLKTGRVARHLEDRLADGRIAGLEGTRKPHSSQA